VDEQILFAEVALSIEAEQFLNTDLGRYLIARSEEDIEDAKDKLATVPYWRKRKIIKLQNEIAVASKALQWMAEVLTQGQNAEVHLRGMDAEE
jgi:hypothetical protein